MANCVKACHVLHSSGPCQAVLRTDVNREPTNQNVIKIIKLWSFVDNEASSVPLSPDTHRILSEALHYRTSIKCLMKCTQIAQSDGVI